MTTAKLRPSYLAGLIGAVLVLAQAFDSTAAPRLGRAVIVDMQGSGEYESPHGTFDLEPAMALTHALSLRTDAESGVCAVLTPGAVMCIDERSELRFDAMEHGTPGGLPSPGSGQQAVNRMAVTLKRGAILVNAGEPVGGPSIEIRLGSSATVKAEGGRFTIGREADRWLVHSEQGDLQFITGDTETAVMEGHSLRAETPQRSGGLMDIIDNGPDAPPSYEFHTCREYFRTLQPLAFDWRWEGLEQLQGWIDGDRAISFVGNPSDWEDVSPTRRTRFSNDTQTQRPAAGGAPVGGRRPRWDMWEWHRARGDMRGVNYIPRTAVNTTEMWQKDTFDPDTIGDELEWANDCGYNSVRVFVQYAVWKNDSDGLKERMEEFLKIAADHDLGSVFVLFDDMRIAGRDPQTGPQPDPVPGVYNSQWTPSPGHALVPKNQGEWKQLERYVEDIVGTFRKDSRVVMWDIYNRPGHSGMGEKSLPLVEAAFEWARAANPSQPLTAGVELELGSDAAKTIMDLSDVLSFNAYESAEDVESRVLLAGIPARPVVCSGWLRRGRGNTFEDVLPVFAKYGVGWYHWGLVAGRTQMYLPWDHKPGDEPPTTWEQDVLDEEGNPFDGDEVELVETFRFDPLGWTSE